MVELREVDYVRYVISDTDHWELISLTSKVTRTITSP
jgi:hypothetical protein